jgi:hypothetical protein
MSNSTERTERTKTKALSFAVVIVVVSLLGYFAFRTLRGLMMLGYVDSAMIRLRVISAAEADFSKAHPALGYRCTLSQLPGSDVITRLLAKDRIDNGYVFEIAGCQALGSKPNSTYQLTARPLHSELPAFCSDQSGVVKSDARGSVEKCLAEGIAL